MRPSTALALTLLLAPTTGIAAGSDSEILDAARDIMLAARFCTFATLDETGHPNARMMDPFEPEEDFTVWMATHSGTRKARQIARDPRASLTCFDPRGVAYVTLVGRAEPVDDAGERSARFKPEWSDFYEDEHRGEDYLLIRLEPSRVEVVSQKHGIAAEPRAWKAAVVELDRAPD